MKTCDDLKDMRGDKSGAAVVVGAMRAASALNLPLNIRGNHRPLVTAIDPVVCPQMFMVLNI